jgi:hypothetical protein
MPLRQYGRVPPQEWRAVFRTTRVNEPNHRKTAMGNPIVGGITRDVRQSREPDGPLKKVTSLIHRHLQNWLIL